MSDFLSSGCAPSDCASCSAGCDSRQAPNKDPNVITLTMTDDTQVNCVILTIFPVGDQEYIALLPLDENGGNTDGEVYLYKFSKAEDGSPLLANIVDDDEYEAAGAAFDQVVIKARADEAANEPIELDFDIME